MKNIACIVVAAVLMMSAVSMAWRNAGNKVGVKVAVSQGALTYLKDQMLPAAEAAALSAKIPDMSASASVPLVGTVDVTLSNIKLNRLQVQNSSIQFNSGNVISVSITGLNMDVTLNWHYRESPWPHISDSGSGEGSTSHSSGVVGVTIGTDSTGRPSAKFGQCSLDLSDFHISIHGGASWLYNAVISMFHGKVVSALESALCEALHNDIQKQLDEVLSEIPVQMPVGKHLAIDYSLAVNNGLIITPDKELIASSAGEFYPRNGQPGKAPGTPVQMPNSVVNNKEFQIFVSSFSAESLGYAAVKSGICEMLVTKDQVPEIAQALFTTDFFASCAPGLVTKYGAGKDIAIFLALHTQPSIEFSKADGVLVKAGIEMTIRGKGQKDWEDAFTVLLMTTADATVKVNNTVISGEILEADAKTSLVSTHVGDVDVSGIDELVTFALSMSLDTVNEILAKGTPLPSMQGLSFKDPSLIYNDGYIAVVTDINFTLPTSRHH